MKHPMYREIQTMIHLRPCIFRGLSSSFGCGGVDSPSSIPSMLDSDFMADKTGWDGGMERMTA